MLAKKLKVFLKNHHIPHSSVINLQRKNEEVKFTKNIQQGMKKFFLIIFQRMLNHVANLPVVGSLNYL